MMLNRDPNDRNATPAGQVRAPYHRRRSTWGGGGLLLLLIVALIVWWAWDEPDRPLVDGVPPAAVID